VAERPSVLPPMNGGSPMAKPTLAYRIWQRGTEWHWQVMTELKLVLKSGIAQSSAAARVAAFTYCLQREGNQSET